MRAPGSFVHAFAVAVAFGLAWGSAPRAAAAKPEKREKAAKHVKTAPVAASPAAPAASAAPAPAAAGGESRALNDAWYTMQAGSTPWGYFRERIELREGRYFYRYEMTKRENAVLFQESLGAVAEADLTPVAFNLSKAGSGATEIINGAYARDRSSGVITVEVKGGRSATVKRHVPKGTILEVFFPVWLSQRWKDFKPGYRGWLNVFTEDAARGEFTVRKVTFAVKGRDDKDGCTELDADIEGNKSLWCLTPAGALVRMDINGRQAMVRRVSSEKEAKDFLEAPR